MFLLVTAMLCTFLVKCHGQAQFEQEVVDSIEKGVRSESPRLRRKLTHAAIEDNLVFSNAFEFSTSVGVGSFAEFSIPYSLPSNTGTDLRRRLQFIESVHFSDGGISTLATQSLSGFEISDFGLAEEELAEV